MSDEGTVTVIPPAGSTPSVLQLPATGNIPPNADGTFTVSTLHLAALLAAGWSIKVPNSAHVP